MESKSDPPTHGALRQKRPCAAVERLPKRGKFLLSAGEDYAADGKSLRNEANDRSETTKEKHMAITTPEPKKDPETKPKRKFDEMSDEILVRTFEEFLGVEEFANSIVPNSVYILRRCSRKFDAILEKWCIGRIKPVISMRGRNSNSDDGSGSFGSYLKHKECDSPMFKAVVASFSGIIRIEGVKNAHFDDFVRIAETLTVEAPILEHVLTEQELDQGLKHRREEDATAGTPFVSTITFEIEDVSDLVKADEDKDQLTDAMETVLGRLVCLEFHFRREGATSKEVRSKLFSLFMGDHNCMFADG